MGEDTLFFASLGQTTEKALGSYFLLTACPAGPSDKLKKFRLTARRGVKFPRPVHNFPAKYIDFYRIFKLHRIDPDNVNIIVSGHSKIRVFSRQQQLDH